MLKIVYNDINKEDIRRIKFYWDSDLNKVIKKEDIEMKMWEGYLIESSIYRVEE